MAKKNHDWDKAKALFGMGKTTREIEKETGIIHSTVSRRAIKEGWVKNGLQQAVSSGIKYAEDLQQKTAPEKDAVQREVERVLKAKGYIENVSLLGLKRLSQLIPEEIKISEVKAGIEGAKTAMVTLGVVDYYPAQKGAVEPVAETGKKVTIIHAPAVKRVD